MDSEPRILVLRQGYSVSALADDIRTSLSDSVVIDARLSDLLKNEADFRLVLHYARDEGKRITVITRDPVMTALAARLDVEVLNELQGHRVAEPPVSPTGTDSLPDREEGVGAGVPNEAGGSLGGDGGDERSGGPIRSRGWPVRVLTLIAAVALVVGAAGLVYVFGLRVEVTVVPATVSITETVIIAADPRGRQLDWSDATPGITVPSQLLSVDVEYSTEIPTTGERREGITPSVGEVLFINSSLTPVRVPSKTRLRTADGVEFETVNDVEVSPKTIIMRAGLRVGETNGTALVAATACSPGSAGNVPALSIRHIEGPLADRLQVINENEFRGGRDRVTRIVSESDAAQLRDMSERWMLEDGAARLRKLAGLDRYLLMPTLELHVRSSRLYPDLFRESDRVSIDADGRVNLASVDFSDLCAAIEDKLSAVMDDRFHLLTDTLQIDSLSCARLSSGVIAISVDVSALFVADVDKRLVAAVLVGEDLGEARRKLLESGQIAEFTVDARVERFPRWSRLIDVVVSEPTGVQVVGETDIGEV